MTTAKDAVETDGAAAIEPACRTVALKEIILAGEAFSRFALGLIEPVPFRSYPPPILLAKADRWIPVTGHGRLLAAQKAGREKLVAGCVGRIETAWALALCALALAWERPLTHGLRVEAAGKLYSQEGEPTGGEVLARALGIEGGSARLERYARVWKLGEAVRADLHAGRLDFGCALAVTEAPVAERPFLIDLFANHIHPNRNTARRIVENAVSAALVRRCSVGALIQGEPIASVLTKKLSGPEKIAALDRIFRRLRYPTLEKEQQKANKMINDMNLPKYASVALPKNLEGRDLAVTLRARSVREVEQGAQALLQAAKEGGFAALFQVLEK